jgi:hypothetical protein
VEERRICETEDAGSTPVWLHFFMNRGVTGPDWERCLRVLQASARGEYRELENERWKTLLNSVYRRLRKEAKRTGEPWFIRRSTIQEPSCIQTLRLLAMSAENRQLAVKSSNLRQVLRKLRREIRLDLRSEPQRRRSPSLSDDEYTRTLEVLRVAKDSPKDIPNEFRAELASVIHEMWRQARRISRRQRMTPRRLHPGDCQACERELLLLCDGLRADGDYRVFKGLLAKVERAFEKDIHQGRSSAEERRHHKAEDAGSSPAGPDLSIKRDPRSSVVERFFKWILSR